MNVISLAIITKLKEKITDPDTLLLIFKVMMDLSNGVELSRESRAAIQTELLNLQHGDKE